MMELLNNYIDWCDSHKWLIRIVGAFMLVLHVILNTVYMGKPMPVNGIVLQPWMAYVNVIGCGILVGVNWGFTSSK